MKEAVWHFACTACVLGVQTHKYIKMSVGVVTAVELEHFVVATNTHVCFFIVGIAGMALDHFKGGFSSDIRLKTERQTDRQTDRQYT